MARRAAVAAAIAAVSLLAIVTLLSSTGPTRTTYVALMEPGGERRDVPLSALEGQAPTSAMAESSYGFPVLLVKVPTQWLEDAEAATGEAVDRWAVRHPSEPDMSLLAYNAKSTHLGCTVFAGPAFELTSLDGIPFLRLMDACHHGQWNALAMAANVPGTVAPRPLAVVPFVLGPGPDPTFLAAPAIEQQHPFDAAYVGRPLASRP